MNIVILDGYVANPGDLSWERTAALGNLTVYPRTEPADVIERASQADALLVNKVILDAATLAALPRLRYIGVLATGYNNVDLAAADALGITVTNVPAYSGDSVAQLVMALLLELAVHAGDCDRSVHRGDWAGCRDFSYTLGAVTELAGLTMGIYGMGNIGCKVARIAMAFGMKVISPTRKAPADIPEGVERTSFDEMLSRADVISINAPLTADNRHLFDADVFERMKPTAMLINTARGPIVDEQALADAIRGGIIAGAGVDVLEQEPPRNGNPLLAPDLAGRCIVTPHIGWQSTAARRRLLQITADNLAAFIAGTPRNVVNHPAKTR